MLIHQLSQFFLIIRDSRICCFLQKNVQLVQICINKRKIDCDNRIYVVKPMIAGTWRAIPMAYSRVQANPRPNAPKLRDRSAVRWFIDSKSKSSNWLNWSWPFLIHNNCFFITHLNSSSLFIRKHSNSCYFFSTNLFKSIKNPCSSEIQRRKVSK